MSAPLDPQPAIATSVVPSRIPALRQLVAIGRLVKRWFSRREIIVRLLGLPPVHPPSDDPGLIILQIDGLSRRRLDEALAAGRVPFLASLVHDDGHCVHTLYSGVPATTPAVLGELFYGVEQAVPAYSFRDHRTGRVFEMLEESIAEPIQKELAACSRGLLQGGSAYCDIYSGGADEAQFCPGRARWKRLDEAGVWKKAILVLLHLPALARMSVEVLRESVLVTWRLMRRRTQVRNWLAEIKFIPRHLIASVVLREATAAAVESDAVRGVSRVHANFLGYDDVAHHCGPDSDIARRALRDIDRSIDRIWHAAHASPRRNYQVWIIADHGQEAVLPYSEMHGRSIDEAVCEAAREFLPLDGTPSGQAAEPAEQDADEPEPKDPLTVAIGPLGHVYWPGKLADEMRARLAQRLVSEAKIPLVMTRQADRAVVWTPAGEFRLPDDAATLFGEQHPHLSMLAEDFEKLARHRDAGDLVICGWRRGERPVSFVDEVGAHGGPGPEETSGFLVTPPDAPRVPTARLRPRVLRELALRWLEPGIRTQAASPRARSSVRVATYNVHGCVGLDGRLSPARIARVLASLDADIICLQELDVGRPRSRSLDQARTIADLLEMEMQFGAAIDHTGERYGNAILSRWPMTLRKAALLSEGDARREPRGAVWASVAVGDGQVDVISTHLGLTRSDRCRQLSTLLGDGWPCAPERNRRTVLCGDLNSAPGSEVCRQLEKQFADVQQQDATRGRATWPASWPLRRIDHIFVGSGYRVRATDVPRNRLTRVASDHLPLIADLELVATPATRPDAAREQEHAVPDPVHSPGLATADSVSTGSRPDGIH